MSRWDFSDPDRVHSAETRAPASEQRDQPDSTSPSVGRGGSSAVSEEVNGRERAVGDREIAPRERRAKYQDRGRAYSLRSSEIDVMTDIGRFRAVDVRDLARFIYKGDYPQMKHDLANLRKQELVAEKTVFRAHRPPRTMATLTEQGHRMTRKIGRLRPGQRIYHGFVKPNELEHDADLYKVYQKAAKKIEEKGGTPLRVRLDFELKESINRAREAAGHLPEDRRNSWLEAMADEHGLTSDGKAIHLPDVQLEYQTQDGHIERENLELVSRNYREAGIRGKAAAGFTMYARSGDTGRVRRALRDTGLIREVLSL